MDQNTPAPDIKQQIADLLSKANNVLVTVSANPSVDQLAACIGLTLFLNKIGKHATAVFSGAVPSTLEFLKPEETLEKNTDSLRDFIIALDKSKADKLRYKVEDQFVKIFITPYHTSLSEKDLEFSQGDFNVDVIMALGVRQREELDEAITAHGRILHDATVVSVNNRDQTDLGSINWNEASSSSLCEMLVQLSDLIKRDIIDNQMATAFLTGIVAETNRFSNDRTSPSTMTISARLMSAGANQQLVATKLEVEEEEKKPPEKPDNKPDEEPEAKPAEPESPQPSDDGSLQISHGEEGEKDEHDILPDAQPEEEQVSPNEIHIDDQGTLRHAREVAERAEKAEEKTKPGGLVLEPPTLGGQLTANSEQEDLEPAIDPLGQQADAPLLSHDSPSVSLASEPPATPTTDGAKTNEDDQTLSALEESVHSSHVDVGPPVAPPPSQLDDARSAVDQAVRSSDTQPLEPIAALNAQPLGEDLHTGEPQPSTDLNLPPNLVPPENGLPPDNTAAGSSPTPPPPLMPPPLTPPPYSPGVSPSDEFQSNNNFPGVAL